MRGLLQLFAAYGGFLTFLLLETISLVLIVRYNQSQREIAHNSWGIFMAAVEQRVTDLVEYRGIKEELARLQNENKELEEQLNNIRYTQALSGDSIRLDTIEYPFSYIVATVISNSVTRETNNSLRLNRGSADGVYPNMGVVAADGSGLVGIVREVTPHFCRVMSLLHRQTRIKAAIEGKDYFGTLTWPGESPKTMQLEAVPRHAEVDTSQTVITSGYSQIFPRGIPIGKITKANKETGHYFYDIEVELFNDLSRVRYVYLIKNALWAEHQILDRAEHE